MDFLAAQPCKPYSTSATPSVSVYKAELAYINCIRNTRFGYRHCNKGNDGEEEIQAGLSIWEEIEGFPSPAKQNSCGHPPARVRCTWQRTGKPLAIGAYDDLMITISVSQY